MWYSRKTTSLELLEWLLSQHDAGFFQKYVRSAQEKAFGRGLSLGFFLGLVILVIVEYWWRAG
jgi:hypothetical protein